jgi:predicted nucleic acid-binding protein
MTKPTEVLLDTNALWMSKDDRRRMIRACQQGHLRVYLPALVLIERERQLIQRDYRRALDNEETDIGWSVRFFRQWIDQLTLDLESGKRGYEPILAFDFAQAQVVSRAWGKWLETQGAGILRDLSEDEEVRGLIERLKRKVKSPADFEWTLHKADWSIAAVAQKTGWILVSDDRDPPFEQADVHRIDRETFIDRYLSPN